METVREIVAATRSAGHTVLLEDEAYAIAASLGMAVPRHRVVSPGDDLPPGEVFGRVVVKARSRALAHKTASGGVSVAEGSEAVRAAMEAMKRQAAEGWLIADHVEHRSGFPGEWLLGIRRTRGFGPVVTLAPGGTAAEWLTKVMGPAGRIALTPGSEVAGALSRWGPIDLLDPADRVALAALLDRVLAAVPGLPPGIAEFEVNPLVLVGGAPTALDALARLADPVGAPPARPPERIGRLLHPRTIALVGVSERMNPGRVILRNVLGLGYPGSRVTVVKEGADEIDGARCVPSLAALDPVDLLVVAVGAEAAVGVVEEAIDREVAESIVLVAGGIGETPGTEDVEDRLRAAIASSRSTGWGGPVVNGANCMGIRSVPGGYDALFIPPEKWSPARGADHPVALVAQSGAFVLSRLDRLPWLGPRFVITVGNQVDLTVGDHLAFLAEQTDVEVVALYVEGFAPGDGWRTAEAIRQIRVRGGSVLVMLGGVSAAGADATVTHTASIAADAEIAAAVLSEAGALVAGSLEEFEDLLRLLVLLRATPPQGPRLGAVSNAGFEAVAMADALGSLQLASFGDRTGAALEGLLARAGVAGVVAAQNPLDLTPMAGDAVVADAVEAVLADPGVDIGVIGVVPFTPALTTLAAGGGHAEDVTDPDSVAVRLAGLADRTEKPWVMVVDAGADYDAMTAIIEGAGIPVFRTADRAVQALGRWAAHRLGS